MATYTPNYGLHQWAPEDNFLRTDFNEDFQTIDLIFSGKVNLITGSYSGNSTYPREMDVGVTPKLVLLFSADGSTNMGYGTVGGLFAPGLTLMSGRNSVAQVTDTGFRLIAQSGPDYGVNHSGFQYYYCVLY